MSLRDQEMAYAWFVATGVEGFDLLARTLNGLEKDEGMTYLAMVLSAVRGPGAMPLAVVLLEGKHAGMVSESLRQSPRMTLEADLTAAEAEKIRPILCRLPLEELRAAEPRTVGAVRDIVRAQVQEADLPPFDPATPWWQEAAVTVPKAKLPSWIASASLPALVINGTRVAPEEMHVLFAALTTADRDQVLLSAIRQHVPHAARDAFERFIAGHPVMRPLCVGLVWEARQDHTRCALFRLNS